MRARHALMVVCLGVGLVAVARPAHAEPDYEAAREAYTTAEKAFAKGEYDLAAREFGKAYYITKDPVLFFRIALSYEKSGDCDTAVVYFGRYLREAKPADTEKKLAEQAVARCTKATAPDTGAGAGTGAGDTGAGTGTAGAGDTGSGAVAPDFGDDPVVAPVGGRTTPPPFEEDQPSWKRSAAWISVGVTVAFVTTGAVLGLSASSRQEDIENLISFRDQNMQPQQFEGTIQQKYDDLVEEGEQLDKLSKVAFGLAGAAAISATVFFVLDAKSGGTGERSARGGRTVTPLIGARGELGVSLGWGF
ncbi:MAG TPA: hypothetical protein VML75_27670 [Kofleriaceae bacterium]|nr:hypothetical protein [Kofleriaceae bacterium]